GRARAHPSTEGRPEDQRHGDRRGHRLCDARRRGTRTGGRLRWLRAQADRRLHLAERHRPAHRSRRGRAVVGSKPQTILVVEDNPTTRKLYRATLEAEGYLVLEAFD